MLGEQGSLRKHSIKEHWPLEKAGAQIVKFIEQKYESKLLMVEVMSGEGLLLKQESLAKSL